MPNRDTPGLIEIWKFGGASLADASAVRRAVGLVRAHQGPLVVVVSALGGVTDTLLEGARAAASADLSRALDAAAAFERRHRALIRLLISPKRQRALLALTATAAAEYRDLLRAVAALRNLHPRASDVLVSRGERTASAIVAAALASAGRKAAVADALDLISTDARHGGATPDVAVSRPRARRTILSLIRNGVTPVVPGFIGRAPDGTLATLGRGGSDLTATVLGRCLDVRRVTLWKDVPGILTADPRLVPDTRLIPRLHPREAAEIAYYGAKVLHPRALIPLAGTRAVVHVRSFFHPERPGTEVSTRAPIAEHPVKALATIKGQALVTVAGKGMIGVPGVAARAFEAVHAESLSVSTIFQASSESSIGFTLAEDDAPRAVSALRRAFAEELALGLIDDVAARGGMAVIAVVGSGMAGTPGIAARVFGALAAAGVNVVAIAQGSSELNISFVVRADEAAEATRRVHAAFQLAKIGGGRVDARRHTDVVLMGFGNVGRALVDQLAAREGEAGVRVVALTDRSGCVFDPAGISRRRLLDLAARKDQGALLAALGGLRISTDAALAEIGRHAVSRPILVDVTAEETHTTLLAALAHGFDLVLANKKPLAGPRERYERLFAAAASSGRRIRYEATVGAGLPIIDTFQKLVDSGDRVTRIDGCVSGTLGFVLSAVSSGRLFSAAVREAVARGYAEPDPREDLGGRDVARKAVILARLMDYRGPMPSPDDLVPRSLRNVSRAAFLARLDDFDDAWSRRVTAAARRGRALRYAVAATRASVRVGMIEAPISSPIGALSGTRNLIAFTSRRYRHEPLVVTGPGAGAEVTAAGILNDVLFLALT
ncbi:MAG: aspartate kinase [Vicinamibacteria bacterium]|nr:aspartate kinase [Vicinamibacteria bacterium]